MLRRRILSAVLSATMATLALLPLTTTPVVAEDNSPAQRNFFQINNIGDITDYVSQNLAQREEDIRTYENTLLDKENGDIRKIDIPSVLTGFGISESSISHPLSNEYDSTYEVDISNTTWQCSYKLASQFGNYYARPAEFTLQNYNDDGQRLGWIHVVTEKGIMFETCDLEKTITPSFQASNQPAKIVLAEGEFSANSYELALYTLLIEGVQLAESHESAATPPTVTTPSYNPDERMINFIENKFKALDLAAATKVVDDMLDAGSDIRAIDSGLVLSAITKERVEKRLNDDGTINYSINDGTSNITVSFNDYGVYDRPLVGLEYHGRFAGSSYSAKIESKLEITTKQVVITINTPNQPTELVIDLKSPTAKEDNYYFVEGDNLISAEQIAIIACALIPE